MTFGGGTGIFKAIGAVNQAGADELVKASIDREINFFDTADVYRQIWERIRLPSGTR
jgi:aryl-alcohol dehydrogenase-like predicted oxidoreductase